MRVSLVAVVVLSVFAQFGCNKREVSKFPSDPTGEIRAAISIEPAQELDILFVIDSSGSMEDEQASLATNFQRMIDALSDNEAGLPSLHIGVVTTDLNEPGNDSCPTTETPGQFVRSINGCAGPNGAFIVDTPNGDGTRSRNYQGSLTDTFSCIAEVGAKPCHIYEQPFEAARRVLSGEAVTEGFLREGAFLSVIFITDEDDCSASNEQIFDLDGEDNLSSRFGPRASFRCFEFGTVCDEDDDVRSTGDRTNCQPR